MSLFKTALRSPPIRYALLLVILLTLPATVVYGAANEWAQAEFMLAWALAGLGTFGGVVVLLSGEEG